MDNKIRSWSTDLLTGRDFSCRRQSGGKERTMTKIRTNEEPELRWAKLFAKMYYIMAEQMIESLGEEEGKKAISKAVQTFAEARVASMKEEAAERDLAENGLQTYQDVRDMPGTGWKHNGLGISYCPFHDVWKDYGERGAELGGLYCRIDYPMLEGFGVELERNFILTNGDDHCQFIYHDQAEQ